jgi:hypothetical protein
MSAAEDRQHTSALVELSQLLAYPGATDADIKEDAASGIPSRKALVDFKTLDNPADVQTFFRDIFAGKGWQEVPLSAKYQSFRSSFMIENKRFKGLEFNVGASGNRPVFEIVVTSAWRTVTVDAYKIHPDVHDMNKEYTSVTVTYELLNP